MPVPVTLAGSCYLLAVNLITFALCGWDKHRARQGAWRVPEARLLLLGLFGGCFGLWAGMKAFRHKTRHKKFTILTPLLCLVWLAIILWWSGFFAFLAALAVPA